MKLNEHINILNEENGVRNIFSKVKKTLKNNFLKIMMAVALISAGGQVACEKSNSDISQYTMRNTVTECQKRLDDKVDAYMEKIIPLWANGYSLTIDEMDELGQIVQERAKEKYRFLEKTVADEKLSNKEKVNAITEYFSNTEKEIDNDFSAAIKEFKKRPR